MFVDLAGHNKQHGTSKNTAKLDRETEELHHETVGLDVGRYIQQGRQAKNWTQKDLATVSYHSTESMIIFNVLVVRTDLVTHNLINLAVMGQVQLHFSIFFSLYESVSYSLKLKRNL